MWQQRRAELVDHIKSELQLEFPAVTQLQALTISGLTCVADWIGSGGMFDDPALNWRTLLPDAVEAAGFVQPQLQAGLSFKEVFGFDTRSTQQLLIEQVSSPGTYILEAPMGIGKTEAALYAAYSMMVSGNATGIYFGLPTQLTSNKIHERVNAFIDRILAPESPHRQSLLLHSKSWLLDYDIGAEGGPGKSWFSTGKRGILAPFAVGTVDQALMAAMNVKHGFVRAYGLAGKVVILDEVHTYDSYTGTILDKLVALLRSLHCTVIILSATLTNERRGRFIGSGARAEDAYPLITAHHNGDDHITERTASVGTTATVKIYQTEDRTEAIEEALIRAENGQQVLWIENTVGEAQEAFSILAARTEGMDIECGLLHSRFVHADRQRIEDYWVSRYGKNNAAVRQLSGRILVGTQVLEQSLDIDADFLVTRICPSDMLLQRIGRLWRHEATPRPEGAACETWVLSADYKRALKNPESTFGSTAKIYSPYVLLRTLEVWAEIEGVSLPDDIRPLIEETYRERKDPPELQRHKAVLEQKRGILELLALQGVAKGIQTASDDRARTRYSEEENIEILLLRSIHHDKAKKGTLLTLLDNRTVFLPGAVPSGAKRVQRELAATIAQQTLHTAPYMAPPALNRNTLNWLSGYCYLGDQNEESLLRIALVGDDGSIKELDGRDASGRYRLTYNDRIGYRSIKI